MEIFELFRFNGGTKKPIFGLQNQKILLALELKSLY
jgi:hypothetical protein